MTFQDWILWWSGEIQMAQQKQMTQYWHPRIAERS